MADLGNFNANEVEPAEEFHAIPAGKYQAVITESEMRETKNRDGEYLLLVFELIEGEYRGRKVFARLNLANKNPDAVRIARQELSAICRAVGVMNPRDSVELHNLPLTITVRVRKSQDGEEMNEVYGRGYAVRSSGSFSAQSKNPEKSVSNASGQESAPWKKR